MCLFIALALVSLPLLPAKLSFQDPINPYNLTSAFTSATTAIYNNHVFSVSSDIPQILGDSTNQTKSNTSNKRIEVNLTNQQLSAFENDKLIYNYTISSGKWNRTPTGIFTIWTKIRSQKMSGGSKELGTYYYLPNVPYILFYYNDKVAKHIGYSIHGTYWHDNFGVPMSHGCINMRTIEAANIYNWAEVGTKIIVYGKYNPTLAKK